MPDTPYKQCVVHTWFQNDSFGFQEISVRTDIQSEQNRHSTPILYLLVSQSVRNNPKSISFIFYLSAFFSNLYFHIKNGTILLLSTAEALVNAIK